MVTKIYPQWGLEKLRLVEMVRESLKRGGIAAVRDAVDQWFLETVFQCEVSAHTDRYYLDRIKDLKEFRQHESQGMAAKMGQAICANDAMVRDVFEDDGESGVRRRMSCLVLGRPRMIQDNQTGKVQYIRD